MTCWKTFRSCGPFLDSTRPAVPMPAQLTTTRSGSPVDVAASTAVATWSGSVTSAPTYSTLSSFSASSTAEGRSIPITRAPPAASLRTVAPPRPEAPPVTIAATSVVSMGAQAIAAPTGPPVSPDRSRRDVYRRAMPSWKSSRYRAANPASE